MPSELASGQSDTRTLNSRESLLSQSHGSSLANPAQKKVQAQPHIQLPASTVPVSFRWLGVEHVYLTENRADPDPTTAQQLRDFVSDGFVKYSHEPLPQAQMKIYYDCLAQHAHKHDWMAFFDVDEFLVLISRCAAILAILSPLPPGPRLSVHA